MLDKIIIGLLIKVGLDALMGYVNNFDYKFEGVKPTGFNLFEPESDLAIKLTVSNRNKTPLILKGVKAAISQGGMTIATIDTMEVLRLDAQKTTKIIFTAKVNNDNFLNRLQSVLKNGGLLSPVQLEGRLYIGNGSLPISKTIKFVI